MSRAALVFQECRTLEIATTALHVFLATAGSFLTPKSPPSLFWGLFFLEIMWHYIRGLSFLKCPEWSLQNNRCLQFRRPLWRLLGYLLCELKQVTYPQLFLLSGDERLKPLFLEISRAPICTRPSSPELRDRHIMVCRGSLKAGSGVGVPREGKH